MHPQVTENIPRTQSSFHPINRSAEPVEENKDYIAKLIEQTRDTPIHSLSTIRAINDPPATTMSSQISSNKASYDQVNVNTRSITSASQNQSSSTSAKSKSNILPDLGVIPAPPEFITRIARELAINRQRIQDSSGTTQNKTFTANREGSFSASASINKGVQTGSNQQNVSFNGQRIGPSALSSSSLSTLSAVLAAQNASTQSAKDSNSLQKFTKKTAKTFSIPEHYTSSFSLESIPSQAPNVMQKHIPSTAYSQTLSQVHQPYTQPSFQIQTPHNLQTLSPQYFQPQTQPNTEQKAQPKTQPSTLSYTQPYTQPYTQQFGQLFHPSSKIQYSATPHLVASSHIQSQLPDQGVSNVSTSSVPSGITNLAPNSFSNITQPSAEHAETSKKSENSSKTVEFPYLTSQERKLLLLCIKEAIPLKKIADKNLLAKLTPYILNLKEQQRQRQNASCFTGPQESESIRDQHTIKPLQQISTNNNNQTFQQTPPALGSVPATVSQVAPIVSSVPDNSFFIASFFKKLSKSEFEILENAAKKLDPIPTDKQAFPEDLHIGQGLSTIQVVVEKLEYSPVVSQIVMLQRQFAPLFKGLKFLSPKEVERDLKEPDSMGAELESVVARLLLLLFNKPFPIAEVEIVYDSAKWSIFNFVNKVLRPIERKSIWPSSYKRGNGFAKLEPHDRLVMISLIMSYAFQNSKEIRKMATDARARLIKMSISPTSYLTRFGETSGVDTTHTNQGPVYLLPDADEASSNSNISAETITVANEPSDKKKVKQSKNIEYYDSIFSSEESDPDSKMKFEEFLSKNQEPEILSESSDSMSENEADENKSNDFDKPVKLSELYASGVQPIYKDTRGRLYWLIQNEHPGGEFRVFSEINYFTGSPRWISIAGSVEQLRNFMHVNGMLDKDNTKHESFKSSLSKLIDQYRHNKSIKEKFDLEFGENQEKLREIRIAQENQTNTDSASDDAHDETKEQRKKRHQLKKLKIARKKIAADRLARRKKRTTRLFGNEATEDIEEAVEVESMSSLSESESSSSEVESEPVKPRQISRTVVTRSTRNKKAHKRMLPKKAPLSSIEPHEEEISTDSSSDNLISPYPASKRLVHGKSRVKPVFVDTGSDIESSSSSENDMIPDSTNRQVVPRKTTPKTSKLSSTSTSDAAALSSMDEEVQPLVKKSRRRVSRQIVDIDSEDDVLPDRTANCSNLEDTEKRIESESKVSDNKKINPHSIIDPEAKTKVSTGNTQSKMVLTSNTSMLDRAGKNAEGESESEDELMKSQSLSMKLVDQVTNISENGGHLSENSSFDETSANFVPISSRRRRLTQIVDISSEEDEVFGFSSSSDSRKNININDKQDKDESLFVGENIVSDIDDSAAALDSQSDSNVEVPSTALQPKRDFAELQQSNKEESPIVSSQDVEAAKPISKFPPFDGSLNEDEPPENLAATLKTHQSSTAENGDAFSNNAANSISSVRNNEFEQEKSNLVDPPSFPISDKSTSVTADVNIVSSDESDDEIQNSINRRTTPPKIAESEVVLVISDTESESEVIARRSRRSRRKAKVPFYGNYGQSDISSKSKKASQPMNTSRSAGDISTEKRALSPNAKDKASALTSESAKKKPRYSEDPTTSDIHTPKKPISKVDIKSIFVKQSTSSETQQISPALIKTPTTFQKSLVGYVTKASVTESNKIHPNASSYKTPSSSGLLPESDQKPSSTKPASKQQTLDTMFGHAVGTSAVSSKAETPIRTYGKVSKPGSSGLGSSPNFFGLHNSTTFSRSFSRTIPTQQGVSTPTRAIETPSKNNLSSSSTTTKEQDPTISNLVDNKELAKPLDNLQKFSKSPIATNKRKADSQTSFSLNKRRVFSDGSSLNVKKSYSLFSDNENETDQKNDKDSYKEGGKQSKLSGVISNNKSTNHAVRQEKTKGKITQKKATATAAATFADSLNSDKTTDLKIKKVKQTSSSKNSSEKNTDTTMPAPIYISDSSDFSDDSKEEDEVISPRFTSTPIEFKSGSKQQDKKGN